LKTVNDVRGHAVGDEFLCQAAGVLRSVFRASDILARIGGDEFAVLLPSTNEATTLHMLARVHQRLAEQNAANPSLAVQLSLGAATTDTNHLSEAFRLADQRMYEDKSTHKSKYIRINPDNGGLN